MALTNITMTEEFLRGPALQPDVNNSALTQVQASAVSWGAILAGAAAAAALSLIMLILGVGLSLSTISPWTQGSINPATFGVSTILWISLTQLLASGLGGYLAGRLRTRWVAVNADEIYFRDTAHGLLAWAVASLATAALLSSVIGTIVDGGSQVGASMTGDITRTEAVKAVGATAATEPRAVTTNINPATGTVAYFVDSLFRKDDSTNSLTSNRGTAPNRTGNIPVDEVSRIFMNSIQAESLPPEDIRYVAQVVAQQTGLTTENAEKRVQETYANLQAKLLSAENAVQEAMDKGRKASAYVALWLFISLLVGAFVASWAATYGGLRRDA